MTYNTCETTLYKRPIYGSESPARNNRDPKEVIALYKQKNITHVISLDNIGLQKIIQECKSQNINHQSRLIEDFNIHKKDYDDYFLPLVNQVRNIISKNQNNKILIHCRAGNGRTGTILAALQIYELINNIDNIPTLSALLDKKTNKLLKNHKITGSKETKPDNVNKIIKITIENVRNTKTDGNLNAVEGSNDIDTLNKWTEKMILRRIIKLKD